MSVLDNVFNSLMFKIRAFLITMLFAGLCARVGILLACGKHDYIKRERFDFHIASLTLPLFIEVPVPSQESEQSCIYVLEGNNFVSLDFITIPTKW